MFLIEVINQVSRGKPEIHWANYLFDLLTNTQKPQRMIQSAIQISHNVLDDASHGKNETSLVSIKPLVTCHDLILMPWNY
jgi:hypothetical protein